MLYVITAFHNRYDTTRRFAEYLKAQTFQDFQILAVDDGSTDGTDAMLREAFPDSIILYGNGNLWWGGALHKAYTYLKASNVDPDDYVLIINDDTNIKEDFLEIGVGLLGENPDTFVTAVGYSVNDGSLLEGAVHWDFDTGDNWIVGAGESGNCSLTRALFLRVSDLLKTGGFRPTLLPHYGSDYEFSIRASRKGIKIRSFPELTYTLDEKTTGVKRYTDYRPKALARMLFSKRSSFNPIYKCILLVLVTPLPLLPKVLFHQTRKVITNLRAANS